MYTAEDIPDFRITGESPPTLMREEDFVLMDVTVYRGADEEHARQALSIHLIKLAGLRHVQADGLRSAYLYASDAISAGAAMVQIRHRVFRIRKESPS